MNEALTVETSGDQFAIAGAASYRGAILRKISETIGRIGLPLKGRTYISNALKAPSRAVGAGHSNWTGKFQSDRMGVSIQFESGTLELPAIYELEEDPDVEAYFDQVDRIKLAYMGPLRKQSYLVTPDFGVVRKDRVVLVECKPEAVLRERAAKDPNLYSFVGNQWICPPAQEAAKEYGFEHEIWTEARFPRLRVSNLAFLKDYYSTYQPSPEDGIARNAMLGLLRELGSATLPELFEKSQGEFAIDHIFRAVARREVRCDLDQSDLSVHASCRIFRDPETMSAYGAMQQCIAKAADWESAASTTLTVGTIVLWDDVPRCIVNVGAKEFFLNGDGHITSVTKDQLFSLLAKGVITVSDQRDQLMDARLNDALDELNKARPQDLATGSQRLHRIQPYLAGTAAAPTCRTLRRYLASYRAAEQAYGNGFLGLIPNFAKAGNRVRRLHEDVLEIVINQVGEKYLNVKNVRRKRVFEDISLACEDLGLPAPSYSWFCRFLKSLPKYTVKKLREGDKSAYSLAPRISADPGAANSDEPSASFLRAHIDHTQSDLETIFSETGENLGRPWLTIMIDHYSRRILGFYVSYEPPSYRAVFMTLRDCVRRYGRLPSEIVVDGGKEFRSIWFDVVCAFFRVDVKRRPARKARFGAQIERFFGSANSMLLHTLSGNTQLRKNVRQMTPAVDPSKAAIWTLPALKGLLEEFLFETYETLDHTGVLEKPRNRFLRGLTISGDRPERVIVYDRKFLIATCPSTKKGTAKVQPDGVKINHFYYNAAALGRHLGESVHVRYEPYDLSKAYARVDGEWIELNCRYGDQLRGLGEAELELILDEYKALHGLVNRRRINDTTLAKFMKEVEKSEVVLRARKQAAEQHRSSPGSLDELQNSSGQSAHGTEEREGPPPPTAAADATQGYDRHDEDDFVEDEEFADLETY